MMPGQMMPGQMMPDEGPYGHVAMQPMTPPLQMVSDDHIPLAKCRVLYLGSAVPLETATGLEAVQQPLKVGRRTSTQYLNSQKCSQLHEFE